jgi:hypothetical protein
VCGRVKRRIFGTKNKERHKEEATRQLFSIRINRILSKDRTTKQFNHFYRFLLPLTVSVAKTSFPKDED